LVFWKVNSKVTERR